MEMVQSFMAWLSSFLDLGLMQYLRDFGVWIITKIMIAYFETKIFALTMAFEISQNVINALQVSQKLTQAFSSFDSKTINTINFLRIPECINIILSAYMTRIALRFVPFG